LKLIEFASSLPYSLDPSKRKDSLETLYVLLQKYIIDYTNMEFDQENCSKLQKIFQIRPFGRWIGDLKEYVVYFTRTIQEKIQREQMAV
jgi:hypothetical protein